jgi:cell division protein FtsZ
MGDAVRVTVIAAGFNRWDDGGTGTGDRPLGRGGLGLEPTGDDEFGDDVDLEDDDDFDVPSFLK